MVAGNAESAVTVTKTIVPRKLIPQGIDADYICPQASTVDERLSVLPLIVVTFVERCQQSKALQEENVKRRGDWRPFSAVVQCGIRAAPLRTLSLALQRRGRRFLTLLRSSLHIPSLFVTLSMFHTSEWASVSTHLSCFLSSTAVVGSYYQTHGTGKCT